MKINSFWERILLAVFIVLVAGIFVTTAFSRSYMDQYTQLLQENLSDRLIQTARSAAELMSLEELNEYTASADANKPTYEADKQKLIDFAEYNDVLFVYYVRNTNGQLSYVMDNDLDPKTMVTPGMETEPDGYVMTVFDDGMPAGTDMGNYAGVWNGLMSAYAPIFGPDGKVEIIAGVDIEDTVMIRAIRQNRRINILFIFLLIATIIVGVFLMLALRQRATEHLHASMAKSDFLSRMSHEIRTPMNAIIGLSRMIRDTGDVAAIHKHTENIISSSNYLLALINNILDISKIEAGRMTLENIDVNLPSMLTNIHTMISPGADAKHITLRFETDSKAPSVIVCDETHLTQIIMNLLSNAVKFTPENGTITLALRQLTRNESSVRIEFSVTDSGIGIAPENFSKLFDPFEQEDGSTTRKYGGTGLGLSIAKLFTEMMDGHIRVESEPGKGSAFTFDIKAGLPEHSDAEENIGITEIKGAAETQARELNCSGKRFLVVEDNDINQIIAENMLGQFGAICEFANNGLEGVDTYLSDPERFSAIFMDIQMPVMDGYEATRLIRAGGIPGADTVPIIAMTANVFKEDIEKSIDAGMNAHIGKPLDPDQVAAAIRQHI
ncbi:MAG: response regulator [Clostridiales Family XIII bacterium]|nr:response regulator [Clostridiales Family XIII bacterium]